MKRIGILGCTGSVGEQTLEVVSAYSSQFKVVAIAAHSSVDRVAEQFRQFMPECVALTNPDAAKTLEQRIGSSVISGSNALVDIVDAVDVDMWVVAVVGTAALSATMAIIRRKIPIALACKEVLVSAGTLIMAAATEGNVPIIPVDSEHAALKQCLASVNESMNDVSRLILTASGGPFLNRPAGTFDRITPEDALKHPKWSMGAKISIDSSTLMNKGLEVIEAHFLFNTPFSKIDVVIHPESIVHSFIEVVDGTVIAQLGTPDMKSPIQYALTYPRKWPALSHRLDLTQLSGLHFCAPDTERFPLLTLAYSCGQAGKTVAAVMNAANEAAVGLFLSNKVSYLDIYKIVDNMVNDFDHFEPGSIEDIVAVDQRVKERVLALEG